MSAYANSRQIVNPYVSTDNPIDTTAEGYYSLQQAYGRTSKNFKLSPGVYHNTRLGQRHKATDHQQLHMSTVSSQSAQNSVSSRQPKQSSSGVYASLGQIDQDGVYRDLTTAASPSTLNSTSNRKLNQPSSGVYASLGQVDQDGVYQDLTTAASPSTLNSSSNRKPNQPLSGVYASLGQIDQDGVYQDLTTAASPSTLNSTSNRKPNQPLSGVYATLGQIDQDDVYQDLDTVASPATPQQASNSKPEQPSSSGAYVNERYRDQENACQELALQTIGLTVHHHVNKDTPKSCQTLQQMSGECANVMVPKDVYKDASGSTTPSVAIMDQHSNTNNTTPEVFQKDKATDNQEMSAVTTTSPSIILISTGNEELQQTSLGVYASLGQRDQDSTRQPKQPSSLGVYASPTDVESPEVDNIYDEPNLGDNESDFTYRRERAGTISEPGRKCTILIQYTKTVVRITLFPIVLCIIAIITIIVISTITEQ